MAHARTAVGIKDTKPEVKHPYETNPPAHKRYVVEDDNWGLAETALPVTHHDVSSDPRDAIAASCNDTNFMRPVYNDQDSAYMAKSHTDGKKK
jgi:hypothetical protein